MSDSKDVVCECNHLTNFGIIVDFIGAAPASDPGTELFVITSPLPSGTLATFFLTAVGLIQHTNEDDIGREKTILMT